MKRQILFALSAGLLAHSFVYTDAQARPRGNDPEKYFNAPQTLEGKTVIIPMGTIIEGRMNSEISSKNSTQGEKFTLEITTACLANGTDVVIPAGSKIEGEVVEAIPASKIYRRKGVQGKPTGKLRTQLNTLRTPDGISYPLTASIAGELISAGKGRLQQNPEITKHDIAYMGSVTSFAAVHPGVNSSNAANPLKVTDRRAYMKDPILGSEKPDALSRMGRPVYRSLVRIKQDIYIREGSPLNVRLDSPLKISVSPGQGKMSIDYSMMMPEPAEDNRDRNFRRFKPVSSGNSGGGAPQNSFQDNSGFPVPTGNSGAPMNVNQGGYNPNQPYNPNQQTNENQAAQAPPRQQAAPDPEGHLPRFLRTPRNSFNDKYEPPITAGDGYQVGPNPNAGGGGGGGGGENPNAGGGQQQRGGGGDDF